MDFELKLQQYKVLANSRELVDLSKGFHGIHDIRIRKTAKSAINMDPSKLDETSRYRRYFVKIDDNRFYRMSVSYEQGLKSQIVYQTNVGISELFRSKCLNYLFHNLAGPGEAFLAVRKALTAVINLTSMSYDFEEIVTDIPTLTGLKLMKPIKLIDASLIKANDAYDSNLNLLIDKYGKVPLRVLPADVLSSLIVSDTTIPEIAEAIKKKVLLISGFNKFSCGLLYRELSASSVVLPVTLFNVGSA